MNNCLGLFCIRYFVTNSIRREESYEVKNKGASDEEIVLTGVYSFKADDGYKYFIQYTIDGNGTTIDVSRTAIHRIPPNALKSLVG